MTCARRWALELATIASACGTNPVCTPLLDCQSSHDYRR
jgi:hypothetical protein